MADFRTEAADDDVSRIYESRSERMRRRFSLIVINILGFISCLGFSIVLTSAFPYLVKMDPSADKMFLGWVIAANPLGQLISSPLVGYVANRWKSVRLLCIVTGILNVIGFALYASVGALPQPRKYWIIMARFIVGFAAGSVTLCIMYISKATTIAERTTFISMNAFVQTVGFILGPVIQSSLISLGEEGYSLGYADWALDMYTVAAWISCGLALIGILLFTPCIFQEFDLGEREAEWNRIRAAGESAKLTASHEETQNGPSHRPVVRQMRDSIGMGLCIANFFIVGFIFILIETLATPLAIDQLGYTDEEAVEKVGIVFSAGCALTAVSFACSGPLAKRITERRVLVFCGLLPLIISYIVVLPYSGPPPPILDSDVSNETTFWDMMDFPLHFEGANSSLSLGLIDPVTNATRRGGCPRTQEWCLYTSAVKPIPLVAGFMITAVGYAFASTMSTSTLTQVIAPGEQGMWMGIYLAGGSLSRILGPIYLSYVYTLFGTWMTFGSIIAILVIALTINLSLFKHLIPLLQREPPKTCVL